MKAKSLVYFLLLLSALNYCKAQQKGFIYVHLRSTSEDTSVNISFNQSGSSTTVPSFTLNDRPYLINNIYDIGASHGTTSNGGGDGELWAVTSIGSSTDGKIYRRAASGGKFSPSNMVSNSKIIYYGQYSIRVTDRNNCIGTSSVIFNSTSCTLLSVTLLNFNAEKKDEKGLVYWSTSTEINNDHFEIERSIDGVNWIKIGVVAGNQISKVKHDYQFTDVRPQTGKNYYRLKQVDVDGKFTYSVVRYLEFNSAWNVAIFPNPVSGNYLRVNSNETIVRVHIVDITGRILLSYIPSALPDGTFDLNIDKMTAGGYTIRVINEKGDVRNLKMIKGSR